MRYRARREGSRREGGREGGEGGWEGGREGGGGKSPYFTRSVLLLFK